MIPARKGVQRRANGATVSGVPKQGASRKCNYKNYILLKCCNYILLPIVRLLTHVAFFETCFFYLHWFLRISNACISHILQCTQGRIQGGAIGASAPLKPTKVTFFTMIFYNLERHLTAS